MVLRRTHSYISNVHLSPSLARLICETKGPLRVTARLPTKALILPLGSATCRGSFQEPTSACRRWTLQSGRSGFGQPWSAGDRPRSEDACPKRTGRKPPIADFRPDLSQRLLSTLCGHSTVCRRAVGPYPKWTCPALVGHGGRDLDDRHVAAVPPECCFMNQAKGPPRGGRSGTSWLHCPVRVTQHCGLPMAQ